MDKEEVLNEIYKMLSKIDYIVNGEDADITTSARTNLIKAYHYLCESVIKLEEDR